MNARDYLSLWFRCICTECHQPTSRLADLRLEARVCSRECMEKVLVTRWLVPVEIREHVRSSTAPSTFRRKRTYYLRLEVEAVKRYYAEISGDQAAMSSWEQIQRGTQADNSSRAQKTIELVVSIRSNWEGALGTRYAEEVLGRLEHTPFDVQVVKLLPDRVAAFNRLIRQPKLFDEQEWVANVKPSVMKFLKKNVRDTPRELRKRLAPRTRKGPCSI
ncbi:hypothetical protein RhiJN_16052 [Ceratobasidium sp. AG-Ba]|nr:hypothetical protein RhiJN_16052 [Ceratobasidium sp. AG-Ba]